MPYKNPEDEKRWRENNKEWKRRWNQENKEKMQIYHKQYEKENKERIKQIKKTHYDTHKHEYAERAKKYTERKKEELRQLNNIWYYKNRQLIDIFLKQYEEKRNDRKKEWQKQYWLKKKEDKIYRNNHRIYDREYKKRNPEKDLQMKKKRFIKLGKALNISSKNYSYALLNWSQTIKKQQGEKCVICGSTHKINAHHIFHKAYYPKLSLNPNNGIILCNQHHREAHGWETIC